MSEFRVVGREGKGREGKASCCNSSDQLRTALKYSAGNSVQPLLTSKGGEREREGECVCLYDDLKEK